MIDIHALIAAIHLLGASWQPWLVVVPGILIGLLIHAVPGLTTSMALAICLPLIPYMDFLQALIFMTAMYAGALFGVAIPAILLNVPGSAAAVGTTFDGFPMAQAGRHNEALGLALASSCCGQMVAYLLLLVLAQPIAAFAIRLGPPEILVVALWGMTLIARLRGRHLARGLLAGVFGLLLGTVGLSVRGAARGTFGFDLLLDGIPIVPAIVGLFAAAELFNLVDRDYIVTDLTRRRAEAGRILAGMRDTFRYPGTLLRGALLGTGIGILPGGHAIANLLSYSEAKRAAKDPERFGTGDPRGIIAAELANASSEGGSMATLLALGIPTGGATAVMLVAFSMHNITGGPAFMRDHADLVYAVILSSLFQVVVLAVVGFGFIFVAGYVVKVRLRGRSSGPGAGCCRELRAGSEHGGSAYARGLCRDWMADAAVRLPGGGCCRGAAARPSDRRRAAENLADERRGVRLHADTADRAGHVGAARRVRAVSIFAGVASSRGELAMKSVAS